MPQTTIAELPEAQIDEVLTILANAYPDIKLDRPEEKQKHRERILASSKINARVFGAYRDGKLVGCARYHEFTANMFGKMTRAYGLGMVAVDLLHKKEKICRDIVQNFIEYTKDRAWLGMLYPFRPDFYQKMGFGFGTRMQQFRLKPSTFPTTNKHRVRFMSRDETTHFMSCYERFARAHHGMFLRNAAYFARVLDDTSNRMVGCFDGDRLDAYCVFDFKSAMPDNFLMNELVVKELVYNSAQSLGEIFTFLSTQADQVNRVVINTQDDEFYHIFADPRDGSNHIIPSVYHECNTSGVGIMYRVVDIPAMANSIFDNLNFDGRLKLRLKIEDNFFPKNTGEYYIQFSDGNGRISDEKNTDVTLKMDIARFSSLAVGAASLPGLLRLGLGTISDENYIPTLDRIFAREKPMCMTAF